MHSLMLRLMFTYSLWFLLKFDLISVTRMLQAHNSEAKHAQRLCKAVIGLHPGAPHCEAPFHDFHPASYELLTLLTDNYMGKQKFVSRTELWENKVYFSQIRPSIPAHRLLEIFAVKKSIKLYLPAKKCKALYWPLQACANMWVYKTSMDLCKTCCPQACPLARSMCLDHMRSRRQWTVKDAPVRSQRPSPLVRPWPEHTR